MFPPENQVVMNHFLLTRNFIVDLDKKTYQKAQKKAIDLSKPLAPILNSLVEKGLNELKPVAPEKQARKISLSNEQALRLKDMSAATGRPMKYLLEECITKGLKDWLKEEENPDILE